MITAGSEKSFQIRTISILQQRFPIIMQQIDGCKQRGIPDVTFTTNQNKGSGWIEFKFINRNFSELNHFTIEQRRFMIKHGSFGGNCFLFLKLHKGRHYFLFDWYHGARITHKTSYDEALTRACGHWKNKIDYFQLYHLLCKRFKMNRG